MKFVLTPSEVRPPSRNQNARTVSFSIASVPMSRRARSTPMADRMSRNPRPERLDAVDVLEHCLRVKQLIARVAQRYGVAGFGRHVDTLRDDGNRYVRTNDRALRDRSNRNLNELIDGYEADLAVDVASRIVEMRSHERYSPALASVDSWIVGAARNIFRKRQEVRNRREMILRERVAPNVRPHDEAPEPRHDRSATFRAIAARVTPQEAEALAVAARVGPHADRIAAATGMTVRDATRALAAIRSAAYFVPNPTRPD